MAGRFEGVSDAQWEAMRPFFPEPPEKLGKGRPPAPSRLIVNSILYILITGSRWCDLPEGENFAARSTAHRWLQRWAEDGTWDRFMRAVLSMAEIERAIDWSAASVDGSFSPR